MTGEETYRLRVDKERLRDEFRRLRRALEDYRALLAADEAAPGAGAGEVTARAVALLRHQQLALLRARVSLGSGELALALLQQVLARLPLATLRFRARTNGAAGNGHAASEAGGLARGEDGQEAAPELGEVLAALGAAAESAPLELQDKLRRVLGGIADFFTALATDEAEQLEAAIARVNLATANPETRSLLREIAIVTRDVYRTLQTVSAELPLDALSQSSGGITEAVQRLNSVVVRLDEAASQNLDHLEQLNRIAAAEAEAMGGAIQALRAGQKRLMQLKAEHPELAEALGRVQARLADEVGGPVMTLRYLFGQNAVDHTELISNHSFQELTGRTLKKTIEFVQSLETELYDLLKLYRPAGEGTAAAKAGEPGGPAAPGPSQTQDDVDKLLGELGF
jgi:chemotaxis regulatin CheY-phosphate phosphatase CheZ